MFHVNQKVVCVNAKPSPICRITGVSNLSKGAIYTIRDIEVWEGVECVRLVEIVERPYHFIDRGWLEPSWRANRFRPVVSRKTDISIFTAMLTPSKQEIDA